MAYRAPRFAHLHAVRDVGVAAITLDGDSAHADFPVDNLIDDRAGTLFKFSASVVDPAIVVDLGANFVTGIDRIIIPSNHNIDVVSVIEDTVITFDDTPSFLVLTEGTTPGEIIDVALTTQSKRFIALVITGTAQFFLPQLILTETITFTKDPKLANAADEMRDNSTRIDQPTGEAPTVQHGPNQRVLEYEWDRPLSGADLTKMEALIDNAGMSFPLWVDPASFSTPPETDEPVLWMKLQNPARARNAIDVPKNGTRGKTFSLSLIESVD